MLNSLPLMMLVCLTLTLLIESLTALICGVRTKRDFLLIFLANLMTNPVLVCVTFLLGFFFGMRVRMPVEILLEISVVFIEGLVYRQATDYKKLDPFLLSLILNAASYLSGFVVNPILSAVGLY